MQIKLEIPFACHLVPIDGILVQSSLSLSSKGDRSLMRQAWNLANDLVGYACDTQAANLNICYACTPIIFMFEDDKTLNVMLRWHPICCRKIHCLIRIGSIIPHQIALLEPGVMLENKKNQ
jgi:hypothetical protein